MKNLATQPGDIRQKSTGRHFCLSQKNNVMISMETEQKEKNSQSSHLPVLHSNWSPDVTRVSTIP